MSENSEYSNDKKVCPNRDRPPVEQTRRRLIVLNLSAISVAAATMALANRGMAQISLSTPVSDPYTPPGHGRTSRRAGVTDNDPSDPPGRGRMERGPGVTNNDPSDLSGQGRRGRSVGPTESDPSGRERGISGSKF